MPKTWKRLQAGNVNIAIHSESFILIYAINERIHQDTEKGVLEALPFLWYSC